MNADEADKLSKAKKEVDNLVKAQQDAFLDKLVSALREYWNALLAANGLLLLILSIIVTLPGCALAVRHVRFIVPVVLCFNLFAILGLLFGCFKSERDHYRDMLKLVIETPATNEQMDRCSAQMTQMRERILRKKKLRDICETLCEICALATIIVSTVLLIVIVWSA